MKAKIQPVKPSVVMLYGYPGSGKTTFAKHLSKEIKYAHIDADRLLGELLKNKNTSDKEKASMAFYIANEFIKSGVGVILDFGVPKAIDRQRVKLFAKKNRLKSSIIWLQIDMETAENRATSRDKRKNDDKFTKTYSKKEFKEYVGNMQNPTDDDLVVISGKHNFNAQKTPVIRKLLQKGVIRSEDLSTRIVKPGLMSLIPKPTMSGSSEPEKRNISIN